MLQVYLYGKKWKSIYNLDQKKESPLGSYIQYLAIELQILYNQNVTQINCLKNRIMSILPTNRMISL
ncbi:hypothetical protein LOK49_LG09G01895 [Camellia lanceoleosa]|uniref:Uncharacterized protein n=1 Tax=Camellia lanceoleosa TaxID=1840588 RepID=A0ACC0GJK6_9ERIC|nr:hypothetical protein LOK49_LG09G01895 [Camellia lanceoleosa]